MTRMVEGVAAPYATRGPMACSHAARWESCRRWHLCRIVAELMLSDLPSLVPRRLPVDVLRRSRSRRCPMFASRATNSFWCGCPYRLRRRSRPQRPCLFWGRASRVDGVGFAISCAVVFGRLGCEGLVCWAPQWQGNRFLWYKAIIYPDGRGAAHCGL